MNVKLKGTPGIYLVGFMGSGKSTIGRLLAHRMGWSFFDTDDEIEAAEKTSIAAIFDSRGEAECRRIEAEIVREHARWIERGRAAVVALGGGAFAEPGNRRVVEDHGVTVWLDCPLRVVERRLAHASHRPLARDPIRMKSLFEQRRADYARADYRIETGEDDPAAIASRILALPLFTP